MNLSPKLLFDILLKMIIPVIGGYIATKGKVLTKDFPDKLSTLVLYVCQPMLLVSSVLGIEHTAKNVNAGLTVLLCGFVSHAIVAVIAFVSTLFYKNKKRGRIIEHCIMFGNCGFFGIPIVRAVLGDIGAFYAGFFIITFNIVLWSYGVFIILRSGAGAGFSVRKIFLNAGTIPCTIGLLLFFLNVPLYSPIIEGMKVVGDSCTPISMIIVGAMLARVPFKRLFTRLDVYYVCLIKLIAVPVVIAVLLSLLGFSDEFSIFGALMMSLPTATSTAMFAEKYGLEPDTAAHTVGFTTVLAVATIPLIMQLVKLIVYAI